MKKKLMTLALLVICLSTLAYGTLAYFTGADTAHNVITSGTVAIRLLEWADAQHTTPFPADGVHNVMPGTTVTKVAEVENTGTGHVYLRVRLSKTITLADGTQAQDDNRLLHIDLDETNWLAGEDGYYYYARALAPGAVTEPLFTAVTFDAAMDNLYQNSTARLLVEAFAVQAANNGDSAMDAAGWPEA